MIKIKGFTLPEIVITIAIVGILSLAAVPVYRGYVRKSIATEGKALLAEINAAEQIFYSRNGSFYAPEDGTESYNARFGVDARKNKYFTSYTIELHGDDAFIATIGEDNEKVLILTGSIDDEPEIIDRFSK